MKMAFDEMEEVRDLDEDIRRREALIEEAKSLDLDQDWSTAAPAVLKLRKKWRQIPYWESAYEDKLAEEFDAVIDTFYAKRKEGLESIQKIKQDLIRQAEKLAESNDFNRAAEEMNELMSQWKAAGSAGKQTDDQLWEAFSRARQTFFDRRHQNWEERQAKNANSRQIKQQLIQQAEALADSEEWNKTSEKLRKMMEEWKAAGFSGKQTDDQLWEAFNQARQKFYDRRAQAYDRIHAEQEEKAAKKQALVDQAVAIAEKEEYSKENTELMKQLNRSWKEIGFCGKEKEDQLWASFRTAADRYFDGLKEWNDRRHTEWLQRMQENRSRKMDLIQKQQRQLRWMENEIKTLLSQSAVDDMEEQIEDKKKFIQQLEEELAELDRRISQ